MAKQTWITRELPILDSVVTAYEKGLYVQDVGHIAKLTGFDVETVRRSVRLLIDGGYLQGIDMTTFGGADWGNVQPTPRAMQVVGAWPAEGYEEAIRVLDQYIADESDPERRSWLVQIRDGFIEIGKGTASGLLTAMIRRAIGM